MNVISSISSENLHESLDNQYLSSTSAITIGVAAIVLLAIVMAVVWCNYYYSIWKDVKRIKNQALIISRAYYNQTMGYTAPDIFEKTVRRLGDKPFIVHGDQTWSYHQVNMAANRLAHELSRFNLPQKSVICLVMENRAEYVVSWMAILKIGCTGALVNTQLSMAQMKHCIDVVRPSLIICDDDNQHKVEEIYLEYDMTPPAVHQPSSSVRQPHIQKKAQQQEIPKPVETTVLDTPQKNHVIIPCLVVSDAFTLLISSEEFIEGRTKAKSQEVAGTPNAEKSKAEETSAGSALNATMRQDRIDYVTRILQGTGAVSRHLKHPVDDLQLAKSDSLHAAEEGVATERQMTDKHNETGEKKVVSIEVIPYSLHVESRLREIATALDHKTNPSETMQGQRAHVVHYSRELFQQQLLSHNNLPRSYRSQIAYGSSALLIYTSGTTGLSKATVLRHTRIIGAGQLFALNFEIQPDDRIYTVLPLFHSSAGMAAVFAAIYTGCSLIIRKKFSTSSFWKDCYEYNATVVQYIGELCRYLLNTPVSPYEKKHRVRLAFGNGLRSDIWYDFQKRFNIDQIGEFYGSTEGNVALFLLYNRVKEAQGDTATDAVTDAATDVVTADGKNVKQQQQQQPQQQQQEGTDQMQVNRTKTTDKPTAGEEQSTAAQTANEIAVAGDRRVTGRGYGAVGHLGPITQLLSGFILVKYDIDRDEILRDEHGRCIPCKKNEPGELLAPLVCYDPLRRYSGYFKYQDQLAGTQNKTTTGDAAIKPPHQKNDHKPTSADSTHAQRQHTLNIARTSDRLSQDDKIVKNVKKHGDLYFRTGDLLRVDEYGFWFFVDRIGDTFRFKGENVSTTEVANILSQYKQLKPKECRVDDTCEKELLSTKPELLQPQQQEQQQQQQVFNDVICYGVEVPNKDGRVCMVAVRLHPDYIQPATDTNHKAPGAQNNNILIDFREFYEYCAKNLAPYARPVFLRVLPAEPSDEGEAGTPQSSPSASGLFSESTVPAPTPPKATPSGTTTAATTATTTTATPATQNTTSTFKHIKGTYRKQGADPKYYINSQGCGDSNVPEDLCHNDPVYMIDHTHHTYVPHNASTWEDVCRIDAKL